MESLEVRVTGERIQIMRRVFDGVDKPERTLIEDMGLARAVGFRGELDDAINQAQEVRAEKVMQRQQRLRDEIAELQKELISLTPPGAPAPTGFPGVPAIPPPADLNPVANARPPRQRDVSGEIVY